jgi:predicted nucleotidyltransferase
MQCEADCRSWRDTLCSPVFWSAFLDGLALKPWWPNHVRKRARKAVTCAQAATEALSSLGVRVLVTGSLARGGFGPHSDIDLLVIDCPRSLKYAIEGIVEDHLEGLPFDVIYLDELPERKLASFTKGAVHASQLRKS